MGRAKTNASQPAAGEEPASNRGGGTDDAEYPPTVVFPPPPKSSAAADEPGRRGRQADDEYPRELMFPQGQGDEYPETVMFPPPSQGHAAGGTVDEYPETVVFPPPGPGHAGGGAVDEYPETVMFPPPENPHAASRPPPPPPPPPSRPQPHNVTPPRPPQVVNGTPVQYHQPMPHQAMLSPVVLGNPWSTGLFDCDQDSTNVMMTAFFPCVTFGQIAEIIDQGQTSCTLGSLMYALLMPILSCAIVGTPYRQRLRQMYNLVQAPGEDWSLHLFCPCCALCQEYRELQHRGYDPALGWMGNMARQQATTTPPKMMPMQK